MAARPGDAQAVRPAAAQAMKRGFAAPGAERLIFEPSSQSTLLAEHDLFRKPASTFRDHALFDQTEERVNTRAASIGGWGVGGSRPRPPRQRESNSSARARSSNSLNKRLQILSGEYPRRSTVAPSSRPALLLRRRNAPKHSRRQACFRKRYSRAGSRYQFHYSSRALTKLPQISMPNRA